MGIAQLRQFLRSHRRIGLDTSVFIYQLEANPRYLVLTDYIFRWLENPHRSAVTSTITMTELLVHPYRSGDERREREFYALLSTYPNLTWIPPSLEMADTAAKIRALHRLKTPDALHAATAIHSLATGMIANDSIFTRVDGLALLVLDDLLPKPPIT